MSFQRYRTRETTNEPFTEGDGYLEFCSAHYEYPGSTWNRLPALHEECWDYLNPGPPYKEGHEFFLKRKTAKYVDSDSVDLNAWFFGYSGSIGILTGWPQAVEQAYSNYGQTAGTYGAQAFKRFRPVQSTVGLGQALGELRDFPSLFKVSLRRFKDLGSGYLNYQFGWRPFVKDLLDFIKTQKTIHKTIYKIRKENDRWIRRRGTLRNEHTIDTVDFAGGYTPSISSYLTWPVGSPATGTVTTMTKDRIWFEAVMKYHILDLEVDEAKTVWNSRLLQKLYGVDLTPSLLWELTPWTWLEDWFVNIGDIVENLTNQLYDNLVAKYAYVMRTRSTTVIHNIHRTTRNNRVICQNGQISGYEPEMQGPTLHCSAEFEAVCKERAKASQWGFGNEGSSLSERQLAILVALGISKL